MAEYSKAFVIGGWSEDHDFLAGLTREVSEGSNRFVDEAESLTLAEALKHKSSLAKEARRRIVIAHSAGFMAVEAAGVAVALNGSEPTPLYKTIAGGIKVGTNTNIEPDEYVTKTGLTNGLMEVLRHPSTLAVPLKVRTFSTVQALIAGESAFPDGRVYLPTFLDEFEFGSRGEVELARSHGIVSHMLPGWHNQALLQPHVGAEQIKNALNEL